MTVNNEYILSGGRVVDPFQGIEAVMDLGVRDGRIADPAALGNAEKIDVSGLVVAPGFIDLHVHLRQPGSSAAETIATGTRAAAAGGFTAVVAMPNTNPPVDTVATVEYLRYYAEKNGVVKIHPCGCMTNGFAGQEMAALGSLKNAGIAAISDDGRCIQNHDLMKHIVEYAKALELPILDHCEDEILKGGGVMHEGVWSVLLGMKGMSPVAEELMVARDIIFARMIDWKIHLQHLSTKGSVEQVRAARKRGIPVTAEVTPHHLALTDEYIKKFDSDYKVNPPLRSPEDRQALLEGLADGTITVIATDHAPHTPTSKLVEFDYAPFGIIGLETAVPVTLRELYHSGILSLRDFVAKFTVGPAEVLGFDNRGLKPGCEADITIIDLQREVTVDANKFRSKSRNTPFNGLTFKGKAVATVVDGKFVFSEL
ncbi:MAG: dihydroorotase [Victivallaceae bacterium]|nr:dihydroorotase [Victivallaceae bacterium]